LSFVIKRSRVVRVQIVQIQACRGQAMMNLRAPNPTNRAFILEALALLAFAILVGIFTHSIIPLLVAD
jgi:uncharacterized membrane protein